MRKIRLGHIGVGHMHSTGKLESVLKFPDLFEVVGLAEDDPAMWERWGHNRLYEGIRRFDSVDELLARDDIDAVLVESDDKELVHLAIRAAEAGKHIHLDKPAGESVEEYEQLMRIAKRKGLVVQLAYMYRYHPGVMQALEMVRAGELGDILQVDSVMSTEHAQWVRDWLTRFEGGTMHTFGCHLIDLHLLFQGVPDEIVAYKRKTGLNGTDVYDHDLAVLLYPHGVSTVRTSSFEVNGYGRRQLVVCGTRGTIEIKPLETNVVGHWYDMTVSMAEQTRGREYFDVKTQAPSIPITGRYDAMMQDFAAFVRGEKENPFTYEYELQLQRACLKACGFDVDIHKKPAL